MRKSYWLVIALAMMLVVGTAFASAPIDRQLQKVSTGSQSVSLDEQVQIWVEDFEDGVGDWTYTDGLANETVFWSTNDMAAHGGTYSWQCYDPTLTEAPYYGADWFQWLKTPNLAANLTSSPELSFFFRLHCEGDNWDGASVWVFYGTDETTHEYAVLTPVTGPAYTGDVNGFSYFADASGWSSNEDFLDWNEVTMDLSAYTTYDYVRVAFVFGSDGNTEEGFGFMVDDIVLNDNGADVFTDDAEDEANSDMEPGVGAGVAGVANLFAIATNDTFPSPTSAFGVITDEKGFFQIYTSPEFDIPELQAGEDLQFNTQIDAEMFYDAAAGGRPDWQCHIWDPEEDQWWYASNIRDISGNSYVYVGGSQGWSDFTTDFGTDWIVPADMAGLEDVKIRIAVSVPGVVDPLSTEEEWFDRVLWDDVELLKNTLEHDIGTVLYVPYPNTVGVPTPGMVTYTNYGVNDEAGVIALWGIGPTPSLPVSFGGTVVNPNFDLLVGGEIMGYISDDGVVESWTPTGAGDATISASHSLAGDQIPDNDVATIDLTVMDAGVYEIGNDTRDFTGFMTANFGVNEGMLYHFDLADFGPTFETGTWNITNVMGDFFTHSAAGGMPADGVDLHVYFYGTGADAPGAALYDEVVTLTAEEAFHGAVDMDFDVSEVAALQNLTGDFWVYVEFLTMGVNYVQPFPLITNPGPLQGDIYRYDGTTITDEVDSAWHITVLMAAYNGVETVDSNVPSTFALNNAYPNPFNPSTSLSFDVANNSLVSLKVYNLMGQEVATLVNQNMIAGSYQTTFDASALSSGVYFVRMQAEGFNAVQKIMLMK